MSEEEKPVEYYVSEEIAKELESIRLRIDENYELTKERAKMNQDILRDGQLILQGKITSLMETVGQMWEEQRTIAKQLKRRRSKKHKSGRRKHAHLHKKKAV